MKTPLGIVNRFLELTNDEHDIPAALALMASDIHFVGPVMEVRGPQDYGKVLEQFLPVHAGWKKIAEFENGEDVCVVDEIYLKTPTGAGLTLKIAERFSVRDSRISKHEIYYDPRAFMKAFGMQ